MTLVKHQFPVVTSNPLKLTAAGDQPWQPYVSSGTPLPPRVNNRALYGPILNQEGLGSCTAFAGTQWRVALRQQAGFPYTRLSELAQYYEERVLENSVNQDNGAEVIDVVKVLEQFGAMPEADDPYDPNYQQNFTNAPPNDWDPAWKLSPSQVFYVKGRNDVKDALARGMAVAGGYTCFAEIESGMVANTGWLPMPADATNSIGGHMTLIIGYDDDLQAFLLMNQWGDNWGIHDMSGLDGCFWMPYAYFDAYCFDVIAGLPDNGVQPIPQPIPNPFSKPTVDVYEAYPSFHKAQYNVGEQITFTVKVTKNGQPIANDLVGIQVDYDNAEKWDSSYHSDANGVVSYTFSVDHATEVSATPRWFTPYGDAISMWISVKVVDPSKPQQYYRVQVGAFKEQPNAVAEETKVKSAGFPAYIRTGSDGYFHVQVGAFSVKANAITERNRLIAAGFPDAFIKFE